MDIPPFAVLLTPPGVVHTSCTCFLLFVAPLHTFFYRVASFLGHLVFLLYIGCIFLSCARFDPVVSTITPALVAVFPCPMRYTLTKLVLTLPPKATFTRLRAISLDTLERPIRMTLAFFFSTPSRRYMFYHSHNSVCYLSASSEGLQ